MSSTDGFSDDVTDALRDDALEETESTDAVDEMEFSLERLGQAYAQLMRDTQEPSALDEDLDEVADAPMPIERYADAEPLDDDRDNAPCPVTEASVLEAILFVGTPPDVKLTAKKLASMVRDVSPKEIKQIIDQLNHRYQREQSVLRIAQENGAYCMVLADHALKWRQKFQGELRDARLNQQVIDVLSIIAYQQPVGRRAIDAIRQKSSGAAIQQLLQRRLIEVDEGASKPRDPAYRTAARFLELFGLQTIDDLPQAKEVDAIDEFID